MDDSDNKKASIPSWQQTLSSEDANSTTLPHGTDASTNLTHAELLEQARDFLKDESIQNASRDRKVAFLKSKGLQQHDIEDLLGEDAAAPTGKHSQELKTVHDSTETSTPSEDQSTTQTQSQTQEESRPSPKPQERPTQRDVPPIITYPEFLLKPQKPSPLITFSRLVNAAYAFTGLAALTYGASKYLVDPMLESLTESRHSLSSTALADLEKLNTRLESTVSHVPYIAKKSLDQHHHHHDPSDIDSITSDPTELFHRDIATQTTPTLSRTPSALALGTAHLDATTHQAQRLASLHTTLTSLAAALYPPDDSAPYLPADPRKRLHTAVADFQAVLDKLESTYNPFRADYYANSVYAQAAAADPKGKPAKDDVAAKVRAEIRNLKGAFLSARNFPTAPRPVSAYVGR